jgi:hypothetical protein
MTLVHTSPITEVSIKEYRNILNLIRDKIENQNVNLFNENDWPLMNQFIISNLPKFENAIQPFIKNLK